MKRTTIIRIVLAVWGISLIGTIIGVEFYVKAKELRLYWDMAKQLKELFNGKKYVDVVFSGYTVKYEKKSIPQSKKNECIR